MRKLLFLAAVLAAASTAGSAAAADPPFPSPTVKGVFVATQTVTSDGAVGNFFTPGSKVVFRAYAVDAKKGNVLVGKDVKFFYVKIPNTTNVKLAFNPKAPGANARLAWTGTWTAPATYAEGRQLPADAGCNCAANDLEDAPGVGRDAGGRQDVVGGQVRRVALRRRGQRQPSGGRTPAADRVHPDERLRAG